jgi:hypothetical protein
MFFNLYIQLHIILYYIILYYIILYYNILLNANKLLLHKKVKKNY